MKKVISINFYGRVVPIEETAYELLKQYVESLRVYFAREEGRDEIINDIEARIAELFAEILKKGNSCITDPDVLGVINSMGRPEDFAAVDGADYAPGSVADASYGVGGSSAGPYQQAAGGGTSAGVHQRAASGGASSGSYQQSAAGGASGRGSLYRNADDKILGGVCSGLANYLNIDPVIMRIVFVILFGLLFWVYIVLWIIVPSRSVSSNITKRLFRNPDQKIIGGVCGGIAAYFKIDVWIPRLIFAFPFIIGLISGGFHAFWWDWDLGFLPRVISGSFGSTLFIAYIILWIAVPEANTSSEKLEMRGEKVDLNSIANTVKEDLGNFRNRAEKWTDEVKSSAQQFGQKARASAGNFSMEAGQAVRRSSSGLGHVITVLFKAFFICVFAFAAIILFCMFIALLFGGFALAPLKSYILEGPLQNTLAWLTLILFFVIPFVALVTWAIRRITGVRSRKHYIGFTFAGLWLIGLISGIMLVAMVAGNFRSMIKLEEEKINSIESVQKLHVAVESADWKKQYGNILGFDMDDDFPFVTTNGDSILLSQVRISMTKSNDSAYHVYRVRESRGSDRTDAGRHAERIRLEPVLTDSTVVLPRGFFISRDDKFRNQQVSIVLEVPVGKRISFSKDISVYNWFDVRHDGRGVYLDDDWDERNDRYQREDWHSSNRLRRPTPGREYVMQPDGRAEAVIR